MVGSTGTVGHRVVEHLVRAGHEVRALTRAGSEVKGLPTQRVTLVPGDLTKPKSLRDALRDVAAVVTTAQGYGRRPTDSLEAVDDQGNRNLADAASDAGVSRFQHLAMFTHRGLPSILDVVIPPGTSSDSRRG
ncbi:MAG: NAD(P)H-binding protein [Thermoplasmata archaeon]